MSPFDGTTFSDLNNWDKMLMLAYNQIREYEEAEELSLMIRARGI